MGASQILRVSKEALSRPGGWCLTGAQPRASCRSSSPGGLSWAPCRGVSFCAHAASCARTGSRGPLEIRESLPGSPLCSVPFPQLQRPWPPPALSALVFVWQVRPAPCGAPLPLPRTEAPRPGVDFREGSSFSVSLRDCSPALPASQRQKTELSVRCCDCSGRGDCFH